MLDWNALYKSGRDFGLLPDAIADLIVSFAGDNASKTLLDIGCGTGHLTRLFSERGYACLGIDTSSEAITIAQSRSDRVEYKIFDMQSQDIETLGGPFGIVTCKHVYAFIDDKELFLDQVLKLLERDGIFVVLTPLLEDVDEGKRAIAVSGAQIRNDLSKKFTVVLDKSLKSGQLFVLRMK